MPLPNHFDTFKVKDVKDMKLIVFLIIVLLFFIAGCAGPARWAEKLSHDVKCGMAVEDVRALTDKPIQKMEVPKDWITHFIRDGSTDLRFGFVDEKLRYVQVAWMQKMMRVASYSRVNICTNEMGESSD